MGENMKKFLLRWLRNEILSDVRSLLRERALKLPSSQVDALAKKFKVKPEVLEMLNEEIATRITDQVVVLLDEYLEKAGR
jgi:DNA-directed RNA polymerase specialized sigma24 family protein